MKNSCSKVISIFDSSQTINSFIISIEIFLFPSIFLDTTLSPISMLNNFIGLIILFFNDLDDIHDRLFEVLDDFLAKSFINSSIFNESNSLLKLF